jgi:hypothetical protein
MLASKTASSSGSQSFLTCVLALKQVRQDVRPEIMSSSGRLICSRGPLPVSAIEVWSFGHSVARVWEANDSPGSRRAV